MSRNQVTSAKAPLPERRYVKGERRYKHVSSTGLPEFQYDRGNPKRVIGKCPNNISIAKCKEILGRAVPVSNGDRAIAVPKRLYGFHEGVVYECRTSDHGTSYHGFPLRGTMPRSAMAQLRARLDDDVERSALDEWVRDNIRLEG